MNKPWMGALAAMAIACGAGAWWLLAHHSGEKQEALTQHRAAGTAQGRVTYDSSPDNAAPWFGQVGVPPKRIAGTVVYDGAAVAGAEVRLWSSMAEAGVEIAPVVITNERGEFDFGMRVAASYSLSATLADREPGFRRVDLRQPRPETPSDAVEIVLRDCVARVYGTTRDAAGGTVASSRIRIRFGGAIVQLRADDRGDYEACVPQGDLTVEASADGYGTAYAEITSLTRVRRDFDLLPSTSIAGTVEQGGAPIAGAAVTVYGSHRSAATRFVSVVANRRGEFLAEGLSPGRYSVVARTGESASAPVDVVVRVGDRAEGVVCELSSTYSIDGRALAGDEPVAGVLLHAMGQNQYGQGEAVSQNDGTFTIRGLQPDQYKLSSYESGYELVSPLDVFIEGSKRVDVQVRLLGEVRGRVTARGKPVHDALVYSRGPRARSSTDGSFVLKGLPAGPQRIGAESKRTGAFSRGVVVEVVEGEVVRDVAIELDLAASITGRVIDQNGAAVAEAYVQFTLRDGNDVGVAQTSADGAFTASAMSGGGDYAVEIRPGPRSPVQFAPAEGTFPSVHLKNGESEVNGVTFVVQRDLASVRGRVSRASGSPVADARVVLMPLENRATDPSFRSLDEIAAPTKADGTFEFLGVPAGKYQVNARSGEGAEQFQDVVAPADAVELTLPDVGRIEGRLIGFTETVRVDARGFKMGAFAAQLRGTEFTIDAVPAGTYMVRASGASEGDTVTVEVGAGETATVELTNKGTSKVVGRVVDFKTKQPVANYKCQWQGPQAFGASSTTGAITDEDGRFELAAPAGSIQIMCMNNDYSQLGTVQDTSTMPTVELEAGARSEVRIIRVRKNTRDYADTGYDTNGSHVEPRITGVRTDSAAATAGLQVGDLIVAVDGEDVRGVHAMGVGFLIDEKISAGTVALTVERAGATVELTMLVKRYAPEH